MHVFRSTEPLSLESGSTLKQFEVAYHTYGELNQQGDNVVWIMHAFSANSNPKDWWPGMVGDGCLFDPRKYYIVCANILGSCYGSTWSRSLDPSTGLPFGKNFPLVTNRDVVTAFDQLRVHLGVRSIRLCVGASLGGQQILEWAILRPDIFRSICPVSTNAKFSAWGIAYNEAQRMALECDPKLWMDGPSAESAIAAARAMAMMSYRTYETFELTQKDERDVFDGYKAASYLQYQGKKFYRRFDPLAYWYLSKMMDAHNVGRGRASVEEALGAIKAECCVVGVSSDNLFPVSEQHFLAQHIPGSSYVEIESIYGHDGFLVEFDVLTAVLADLLQD